MYLLKFSKINYKYNPPMNLEIETMENGGDFELSKFWVLLRF